MLSVTKNVTEVDILVILRLNCLEKAMSGISDKDVRFNFSFDKSPFIRSPGMSVKNGSHTSTVSLPAKITAPFDQIISWSVLQREWGIVPKSKTDDKKQVVLPDGWVLDTEVHHISLLLGGFKSVRAVIYDRAKMKQKPFIALRLRYQLIRCPLDETSGEWQHVIFDTGTSPEEIVWEGSVRKVTEPVDFLLDPLKQWQIEEVHRAQKWLRREYPCWQDPLAYWK
jgi:hypothetical protein